MTVCSRPGTRYGAIFGSVGLSAKSLDARGKMLFRSLSTRPHLTRVSHAPFTLPPRSLSRVTRQYAPLVPRGLRVA